jgi:hypothetical protein
VLLLSSLVMEAKLMQVTSTVTKHANKSSLIWGEVIELVLDGIGVIQTRFFKEILQVVLTRSYLALAVTRGLWVCLASELPARLLMLSFTSGVTS